MGEQYFVGQEADPRVPDWRSLSLPDAWPDSLNFRNPKELFAFLVQMAGKSRQRVEIPADMPGANRIPKYILQEFHNLPNGNYSKRITRGYITGFDRMMLGSLNKVRQQVVGVMRGLQSVVDIGCGGGHLANALQRAGVADVWGVDPSPYLLQHAATDYPKVKFVQGIAEQTGFAEQRFDGIAICFLLHELPPKYLDGALAEFHRILKAGGLLAISEPSALQMDCSWWQVWRQWGWRGLYFALLAKLVHEPFVKAWHQQDIVAKLAQFGFELVSDEDQLPIRQIVARKVVR
ncbi:class I SAM-dependent methyltransferase [Halioxenophilus sp. WMMB6]|uniref:class I SAM-dependent methyltransferase n=1 Tax=Halioxenophilus sp. WMMB6 TaxID=3073815 RepID=UPI00295E443A|nr:methyltransferase domain-containing protein [Halioxenophilus sp. WMMB6]